MKKLLLGLVLLLGFIPSVYARTGTIVADPMTVGDEENTHPVAYQDEIAGGHHTAATLVARDAIPAARRVEGMTCYVIENRLVYELIGGIENSNWKEKVGNQTTLSIETAYPTGLALNNTNMGNGHSLISDGDDQYIAFWAEDLHAVTGKRTKTDGVWGAWTFYKMDGTGGRPDIEIDDNDNHDSITIAIDNDGIIHMTYDMHNESLNYRKSTAANDISNFGSEISMRGVNESEVSYMTFFKATDGQLFCMFRDGGSGDGDTLMYEYSTETDTWAAASGTSSGGKFIDGKNGGYSAYVSYPDVSSNNIARFLFNWRNDTLATSSNNVNYVHYNITTGTFHQSDGTDQTVPITKLNEQTIDPVAANTGLVDIHLRPTIALASDGDVFALYAKNNSDGYSQVYINRYDGTSWTTTPITNNPTPARTGTDSTDSQLYIAALLIDDNDNLYAIYLNHLQSSGITVSVSTDDGETWRHASLSHSYFGWRWNMDYTAWEQDQEVYALLQNVPDVGVTQYRNPIQVLHWIPNTEAGEIQDSAANLYGTFDVNIKANYGKIRFISGEGNNASELSWPISNGVAANAMTLAGDTVGKAGMNIIWDATPSPAGGGTLSLGSYDSTMPTTSGARLGSINFLGHRSTNSANHGARIQSFAEDDWSSTSIPTDLRFYTTAASSTTVTERARFDADGNFGLGITDPTEKLHVDGDALITGNITMSGQKVIYLDDGESLGNAVSAASAGDIIILAGSSYSVVTGITIDKSLTIKGQGSHETAITTTSTGINVFNITATDVHLQGFTLSYTGDGPSARGITVDGSAGSVFGNVTIEDVKFAITGASGSHTAIFFNDASGTVKNVFGTVTSTDAQSAFGIVHQCSSTAEAETIVDIYNHNIITSSAGGASYSIFTNEPSTGQACTTNVYNSQPIATESGTGTSYAVNNTGNVATTTLYQGTSNGTDADLFNSAGTINAYNHTSFNGSMSGTITHSGLIRGKKFVSGRVTIAADDTTPDIAGGSIFTTSANTGATAITDLDNPRTGEFIWIIGGSSTNSSTIADSGNFNLSGAWTASLDDVLILYVQADNDYIEVGRVDN